jgi:hypothetical protein
VSAAGAAGPALRWPALAQRAQAPLGAAPRSRRELLDGLDVSPGNEWLLDETLEDLRAAGLAVVDDDGWRAP